MRKYEKVAEVLTTRIQQGIYLAGSKLPTHDALCEEFSISRSSLHKVLNLLEERMLLERCQGRPSIILNNDPRKILFVFFSSIPTYDMNAPGMAMRYLFGIREIAKKYSYTVTAMEGREYLKQDASFAEQFSGVILSGLFPETQIGRLVNRNIPVVALSHRTKWDIDYIHSDSTYAGQRAAELFHKNKFHTPLLVQLLFEEDRKILWAFRVLEYCFMDCIQHCGDRHVLVYEDIQRKGETYLQLLQKLQSGKYDVAVYISDIGFYDMQEQPEIRSTPAILIDCQRMTKPGRDRYVIDHNHEYAGYLAAERLHQRIYGNGNDLRSVTMLVAGNS